VIVPQEPGTMCARGILLSDISFDFVRSLITQASAAAWPQVLAAFQDLRGEADAWLEAEHVQAERRRHVCAIDARYDGQNFEVRVFMDDAATLTLESFEERFHQAHTREYGYQVPGRAIQIINCRLQAVGQVIKAPLAEARAGSTLSDARVGQRKVYHGKAHGWHDTVVYDRDLVPAGARIQGPAVLEEMSSTTVLGPGHHAEVDRFGTLIISLISKGQA
jgi:N-methylhydantoinase A